jgi:hypothetical protein
MDYELAAYSEKDVSGDFIRWIHEVVRVAASGVLSQ